MWPHWGAVIGNASFDAVVVVLGVRPECVSSLGAWRFPVARLGRREIWNWQAERSPFLTSKRFTRERENASPFDSRPDGQEIPAARVARGRAREAFGGQDLSSAAARRARSVASPVRVRSLAMTGLFLLALFYTIYFMRSILLPIPPGGTVLCPEKL